MAGSAEFPDSWFSAPCGKVSPATPRQVSIGAGPRLSQLANTRARGSLAGSAWRASTGGEAAVRHRNSRASNSCLGPVSDAAEVLRLDRSRVRALAASGELSARKIGGVWLIDRASVERRREHPVPAGRPLSASNAWRVLLLASGEDVGKDVGPVARWRVRDALGRRGLDGLQRLLGGMPRCTLSGGSRVSCDACENATM
jgi:excisionase family DNA binding protein